VQMPKQQDADARRTVARCGPSRRTRLAGAARALCGVAVEAGGQRRQQGHGGDPGGHHADAADRAELREAAEPRRDQRRVGDRRTSAAMGRAHGGGDRDLGGAPGVVASAPLLFVAREHDDGS